MTGNDSSLTLGFDGPIRAVIIGGRGGIGEALSTRILDGHGENRVWVTSRSHEWVDQAVSRARETRMRVDLTDQLSVERLASAVGTDLPEPNLVVNCTGLLHDGEMQPERTWRHLDRNTMLRSFDVHVCGLSLLIRHLIPLMPRKGRSVFASLSARVGSIEDNRLGGWFSYRASKAAQNMVLKTASIEAKRRWPELVMLSLHPGTVDTALSKPFSKRVPKEKLFGAEQAAKYLSQVIAERSPSDSGEFFAWDGRPIPW